MEATTQVLHQLIEEIITFEGKLNNQERVYRERVQRDPDAFIVSLLQEVKKEMQKQSSPATVRSLVMWAKIRVDKARKLLEQAEQQERETTTP